MSYQQAQPTMNTGAPQDTGGPVGPQSSQIPDLMKIGSIPVNTNIDVETDVLDPVVNSDTFTRFRLQNKGILHSNSKLTFSFDLSTQGTDVDCFCPLNIGIHAVVERCVLKSGTKTICETSDFGHFSAYKSTYINPKHMKEREQLTTARCMARRWQYNDGDNASSALGAGANKSDTKADSYTLDLGIETDSFNTATDAREVRLPQYLVSKQSKSNPVFQIALNDLFPFLKMNQLPLFMMKEELDLEIHYVSKGKRLITEALTEANMDFRLDLNETKMVADYIYYPQELMNAYAQQNSKMAFTYVDYRLMKRSLVTDVEGATTTSIFNIGGAGRVVNKVITANEPPPGIPATPWISLFNQFQSQGPDADETKTGNANSVMSDISHNVRYNDNFLYPIDITNTARLFSNLEQAEGTPPYISKDEYTSELGIVTAQRVQGFSLKDYIESSSYWVTDRLNRNERVNSRGIELYNYYNQGLPASQTLTLRCWLETVRLAKLEDGVLDCVYA